MTGIVRSHLRRTAHPLTNRRNNVQRRMIYLVGSLSRNSTTSFRSSHRVRPTQLWPSCRTAEVVSSILSPFSPFNRRILTSSTSTRMRPPMTRWLALASDGICLLKNTHINETLEGPNASSYIREGVKVKRTGRRHLTLRTS